MIQFPFAQWSNISGTNNISNTNTGFVGIGTSTPQQLLDVTGASGSFSSIASANAVFLQDHTNYRGVYLGFDATGQIGIIAGATIGTPSNLAFWNYNGSWFEAMRLTSAGNLGIGTTTPLARLQVGAGSNNSESPIAALGSAASSGPVNALSLVNSATAATGNEVDMSFHTAGNYSPTAKIGAIAESAQPTTDLAFSTYNAATGLTEKMRILGNGNMVIGSATQQNSSYLLDVYGTARAKSIVVNATGADFVFDSSYKLNSLPALKECIDKNHHLPEIASAKEMQMNGVDLGQNQVKLLQKVEELTLYLIDKEKQLNDEKQTTNKQQIEIDAQKDKLDLALQKTDLQQAQLKEQQEQIDQLKQHMQQLITEVKKSENNN